MAWARDHRFDFLSSGCARHPAGRKRPHFIGAHAISLAGLTRSILDPIQ
jgi:hypothetical protein